jgi:hypothetical protein
MARGDDLRLGKRPRSLDAGLQREGPDRRGGGEAAEPPADRRGNRCVGRCPGRTRRGHRRLPGGRVSGVDSGGGGLPDAADRPAARLEPDQGARGKLRGAGERAAGACGDSGRRRRRGGGRRGHRHRHHQGTRSHRVGPGRPTGRPCDPRRLQPRRPQGSRRRPVRAGLGGVHRRRRPRPRAQRRPDRGGRERGAALGGRPAPRRGAQRAWRGFPPRDARRDLRLLQPRRGQLGPRARDDRHQPGQVTGHRNRA